MNGENNHNNNINNNNQVNNGVNQVPVNNEPNVVGAAPINPNAVPADKFVFNQMPVQRISPDQIQAQAQPVQPQVQPQVQNVQPQMQPVQSGQPQGQPQMPQTQGQGNHEYKPPSKFKVFMMLFFFVLLIVFVLFLPDIQMMVQKYIDGQNMDDSKITSGKLECALNTSTNNLDKVYNDTFTFSDNKLLKASYEISTRGDSSEDEASLLEIYNTCQQLANDVSGVEGVTVNCSQLDDKIIERQFFELSVLDTSLIGSHFTEAGLTYPNFKYNEDMDKVESTMRQNGFNCQRRG
ncbi:MAG: hypothetical protein IJ842_06275 [Bacilli bacterium]|nr:hypothetical protein [Bacilli bacterium]